jgi:hypothetical protein
MLMDMSNDLLQIYVADYTEGTMSSDLVPIFEQFLRMNPEIEAFVARARKGHAWLKRYRRDLSIRQQAS